MHQGAWLCKIGIRGLLVRLMIALAVLPAVVSAATFTVDTVDDGVGADVDGMRTFRWAIDQANGNDDIAPTADDIVFDFEKLPKTNRYI